MSVPKLRLQELTTGIIEAAKVLDRGSIAATDLGIWARWSIEGSLTTKNDLTALYNRHDGRWCLVSRSTPEYASRYQKLFWESRVLK